METEIIEWGQGASEYANAESENELHFAADDTTQHQNTEIRKRDASWDVQNSPAMSGAGTRQGTPRDAAHPPVLATPPPRTYTLSAPQLHLNKGTFEWDEKRETEVSQWESFAEKSNAAWKKRTDVELSDLDVRSTTAHTKASGAAAGKDKAKIAGRQQPVSNPWGYQQDSWETEEVRPSTMVMPMPGIPHVKSKRSGPRTHNLYGGDAYWDDEDDEDDEDEGVDADENDDSQDDNDEVASSATRSGSLPTQKHARRAHARSANTLIDDIYLEGEDLIGLHLVDQMSQLNAIQWVPDGKETLTVVINFHFHRVRASRTGKQQVKAIQVFLETHTSYLIMVDRLDGQPEKLKRSNLYDLFHNDRIRRVFWGSPKAVQASIEERLGFRLPKDDTVLAYAFATKHPNTPLSFHNVMSIYLSEHPNLRTYTEAKEEFERTNQRKFSSSVWDREKLYESSIKFSALEGWCLLQMYRTLYP